MLLAGEASGDTLGAELVKELASADPEIDCFGAGGSKMKQAGVDIEIDLTQHAVIGIWEAVRNYGKFKKFFDQLLAVAEQRKPDAVVLIDNPGFNLRFAAALRDLTHRYVGEWRPRVIQYISPQLWAWNEARVHGIARDIDLLLSIFPFEKNWYAERVSHLEVEFVGHPLVDRHPDPSPTARPGRLNLLILPGSREKEITRHLPPIAAAVRRLQSENDLAVSMVLPSDDLTALAKSIAPGVGEWKLQVGELTEALKNADAAIASSGTVTMECAWFRVPTVVLYRTSWPTYALGRWFIKIPHIAMPNVLAGREIFPEFIQDRATAENLATAARRFLTDSEAVGSARNSLDEVAATLGEPGAATRAAKAVIAQMEKPVWR
jgi:lipid-A-disaccharide synthase